MAPEMEVTSTVASGNSNNSSDSDQSNEIPIATVSAVSLSSSAANLHPNIENQFKVSETDSSLAHFARFLCIFLIFIVFHIFPCRCCVAYIGLCANNGHNTKYNYTTIAKPSIRINISVGIGFHGPNK